MNNIISISTPEQSESLKEEYSITSTEFLKVKLAKLRESSEDADKVVLPV